MKTIRLLVLLSFAGVYAVSPGLALAEEVSPALLLQRIEALESEVKILKRQLEVKDEESVKKAPETPVVTASSKEGFSIKSPDDAFKIRLRGYVQADGRSFLDNKKDIGTTDTFVARRVRPIVEGTVYKNFDFLLVPDFGNGTVVLQDGYAEYKEFGWAKIRAGKFKEPFGLERLQSDTVANFAELGFPSALAPNRDTGVLLHGDLFDNTVYYAVGAFNGAVDSGNTGSSDIDTNNDKDVAARVFVQPFRNTGISALSGLGVGAAVTRGHNEGAQVPTLRSPGQATIFTYNTGITADGPHTRFSPQFYYYWNSLGLLGEYVVSDQEVGRASTRTFEKIQNDAWQIAGTYVVTGEDASYKGVTPKNPFDLTKGGWGAWELAARYGELDVDNAAFALGFAGATNSVSRAYGWGLGLNWYLNKNVKWVLDYDRTQFDGGSSIDGGSLDDRETENVLLGRFQVAY